MSLRRRLALLSALAVALAVLLASASSTSLVRDRLRGDIDNDLRHQADVVTQRARPGRRRVIAGSAQGPVTIGTGQGPAALPERQASAVHRPVPSRRPRGRRPPSKRPEAGDRVFLQQAVPPPGRAHPRPSPS